MESLATITIDGVFGSGTAKSVRALQHDLLHNAGTGSDGSAPVIVKDYNQGRVAVITGMVDNNLAACISDMLDDPAYPKLPSSASPTYDNRRALQAIATTVVMQVPFPFFYAIVMQESSGQHFHVPGAGDSDTFVTVGLDVNDHRNPDHVTSRGYGIGQFTLFHHPPTASEVNTFITDPVANVAQAVKELRDKFDHYVIGPSSVADDRIQEVGSGPMRLCRFYPSDPHYLRDCVNCLRQAGTQDIVAGETPIYNGSPDTFERTQYHVGSYQNVPVRQNIPCDWPYAVRRYNGSRPDSYDYQAEVLLKVLNAPPRTTVE